VGLKRTMTKTNCLSYCFFTIMAMWPERWCHEVGTSFQCRWGDAGAFVRSRHEILELRPSLSSVCH